MKCLVVLAVFIVSVWGDDFVPTIDISWLDFKILFGKKYSSPDEDIKRRGIFLKNLVTINEHNAREFAGQTSYKMGFNKYSDLTGDEMVKLMTGFKGYHPDEDEGNLGDSANETTTESPNNFAPESIDWRKNGLVTEVKDQGECGCCYAFSAVGSLEGQMKKKTGRLVNLSEQNLVDCSQREGNYGCDGGWMSQAFKYIIKNGGLDTKDSYPYKERVGRCNYRKSKSGATVSKYVAIPSGDEDALKDAVGTVGPVSIGINAGGDFQSYHSGIYDPPSCPNSVQDLSHAVVIVGYGTENNRDYWIIKNSWGDSWGEKGFMRIARNKGNVCGLASKASYPVV